LRPLSDEQEVASAMAPAQIATARAILSIDLTCSPFGTSNT
jgi:hypothetical protein